MIGQEDHIETIKRWRMKRNTPRFILISGAGERLELAKVVANSIAAQPVIVGKSVDEVREVIKASYTVAKTTIYIFEDGDNMSTAANNAILKITEEPPNKAYFIICCESRDNTLETIRSRSTELAMQFYFRQDLEELTSNELMLIWCNTPQDVRDWVGKEDAFKAFIDWCEYIASNLKSMKGVETFRILEKLKLKEDSEGYDPKLFISTTQIKLVQDSDLSVTQLSRLYTCTCEALNHLARAGIKKDSTVDMWLLNVREVLKDETTN